MNAARTLAAILCLSSILSISTGQTQTLRVDVDLVLINATVTDSNNRFVTGLKPEDFRIWEDHVEQKIEYFSSEEIPLSAGIIFDVSGSMARIMPLAQDAVVTFLRIGNAEDEYFLMEFNDTPHLVRDFTSDIQDLQNRIAFTPATGNTALYDALYLGMEQVRHGSNPRKVLVVITDGMDNHSRYSYSSIKELAKEQDIQIYAIGLVHWSYSERMHAMTVLGDIAKTTGGRALFPNSVRDLDSICQKIGIELKHQYLLGYRSTNSTKDGKWRMVKLKMDPSNGVRVNVRAKAGYYAPALERVSK